MNDSHTPDQEHTEQQPVVAGPTTTRRGLPPGEPVSLNDEDDLDTIQPRSIRRRIEQNTPATPTIGGRVRSQPITIPEPRGKRMREPVLVDWEPEPMQGPWRAKPLVIGLAALAWMGAIGLLLAAPERLAGAGIAPRLLVEIEAVAVIP